MYVRCALAAEDLFGARMQLDALIQRNPKSAPALGERARIHIKLYDFDAAEADLTAAGALGAQPPEIQKVLDAAGKELAQAKSELEGAQDELDGVAGLDALLGPSAEDGLLAPLQATFGVAAMIAMADGTTSPAELKLAKRLIQALVAPDAEDDLLNEEAGHSLLEVGLSDREKYLELIVRSLPDAGARAAAFLVATAVSTADGVVTSEERAVLEQLAQAFGLPASAVDETIAKAKQMFPAS